MRKSKLFPLVLIFLSFSAIYSFINFDSASAQGVIWTYNAGTNTATASGTGSTNFAELVQADIDGGWGVYTADATGTQILCTGKIIIGDGNTATVFADIQKIIVFQNCLSASEQNLIDVKTKSTLTLGTLADATTKATKNGCVIYYSDSNYLGNIVESGGTVNFYSCTFDAPNFETGGIQIYYLRGTLTLYNCLVNGVSLRDADGIYFNTVFSAKYWTWARPLTNALSSGVFDNLKFFSQGYLMRQWQSVTLSNLYARYYYSGIVLFEANNLTVNLINADVDSWTFNFNGKIGCTVYRQYEFDLNVLNGEITDFVQNANVTLYKDGSKIYSALTNSSGMIPTQTLTYGYYQSSTGNTIQNATSPYYLVISHPDWQTYVSRFYITQPLRLTVSMQEPTITGYTEAEKSDYTTIILFVISLILCIIGLALTVPLLPLIALTVSVINVLLLTEISTFNILLIILNIIFTVITIVRTKTKNN